MVVSWGAFCLNLLKNSRSQTSMVPPVDIIMDASFRTPVVEGDIKVNTVKELRALIHSVKLGHLVTDSNKQDIAALLANGDKEIAKQSLELIKEEFTCGICLSLVKQARFLMCSHFFCRDCIVKWTKLNTFCATKCPICRLWFHSIFLTRFPQADSIFELVIKHSEIYQDEKLEEAEQIIKTTMGQCPFDFFDENGQLVVDIRLLGGQLEVVRELDDGKVVYRIKNLDEWLRLT